MRETTFSGRRKNHRVFNIQFLVYKHTVLGDPEVVACSKRSYGGECREIESGEVSLRCLNPPSERMEEEKEATNLLLVHMVYAYHPFLTMSTSITRIERTKRIRTHSRRSRY